MTSHEAPRDFVLSGLSMRSTTRPLYWLLGLLSMLFCLQVAAQTGYPSRPVQLVVITSPGGGADAMARFVAQRLASPLGQSVVVENRAGAGGNIASQYVAKSPADGHTLLVTANNHNMNPLIYADAGYKSERDFIPVVQLSEGPSLIVVPRNSKFQTLAQLVTAAKAEPNTIAYGSAGYGQPVHIAMELFMSAAKIQLLHVPYKGAAPALQDALGGQVPVAISSLVGALPHVTSGGLRALAITGASRWPALPDVPTVAELGYPEATYAIWIGIMAPAGTDMAIVNRLNKEIGAILAEPAARERVVSLGAFPGGEPQPLFQAKIQKDRTIHQLVVERTGMKAQ
jgi:tripartite-type tricarboxylate transporter receptor subunit TctC